MTIGTYSPLTSYKHGCRCEDCVTAQRRYDKSRRVRRARGTFGLVPVDRARAHVEQLVAAGVSRKTIALAIGYQQSTSLNTTLNRDVIRRTTERRILAVTRDDSTGFGYVDATGTTRRLRALACMGWKLWIIAEKAGINMDTASDMRQGKTPRTTERVSRAIAAVYEELCMTDGGDVRTKLRAQRAGWLPPLAWDDIDDPAEQGGYVRRVKK